MKKLFYLIILLLAFGCQKDEQLDQTEQQNPEPTPIEQINSEFYNPQSVNFLNNVEVLLSNSPQLDLSNEATVYVPIKFHDILESNGNGNSMDSNYIPTLLQRINSNFSQSKIEFIQCGEINVINDSELYDFPQVDYSGINGVTFSFLENIMDNHNVSNVLNIYLPNSIVGAGGFYPGFEQEPHLESMLVINKALMPHGLVFEHEIGHWLYLAHTHGNGNINGTSDELVNGSNCQTAGDRICDTPADPNLYNLVSQNGSCEYEGNLTDSNGDSYSPDTRNIMSYTYYQCREYFSNLQSNKMGLLMRTNLRNFINDGNCGNSSNTSTITLSGNLDFGNVEVNQSATRTLTIANTGTADFNVSSINSPNGFSANYNGTITAGNSVDVPVTFTPTSEQNYNGSITVNSNADNGNNSISCSGTGTGNTSNTSTISLSGNLDFGNVEVNQSATRTLTIANTGTADFNVSSINSPNGFSANYNGTITAGNSVGVTLTFTPTSEQNYNGSIIVNSNADNGNNSISCSGTGTGNTSNTSTISLSGNLDFGDIEINQSATRTLTIANTGTADFNVSDINNPNGFSANYSGTVTAGNSVGITVTFTPTSAQNYNGSIIVNSNAGNGGNQISCFGNGIDNNPVGTMAVVNNTNFTRYVRIKKQSDATYDPNDKIVVAAGQTGYYYNLEVGVYICQANNFDGGYDNGGLYFSSSQVNITSGNTATVNINN